MSSKPPPYSETQPPAGFTPASYYQPPPPQPQPMYPQMPPQDHTVIIHTTTSRPVVAIGSGPTHISCPSCHAEVVTTVKHQANSRTHCWALMLCLFICWPCVCLPYCMDSCQSANHYCPNCSSYIGTFEN